MHPKYLTCEADINFPVPNIHQVTAHLRAMYDGQAPVSARALALSLGLVEGAIVPVLRRAAPSSARWFETSTVAVGFRCRPERRRWSRRYCHSFEFREVS